MKNYAIIVLLILTVALATCLITKAQTAQAASFSGAGPVATCLTKIATDPAAMCVGTDDVVFHLPGTAGYTVSLLALSKGVTPVQVTINGTTKTLPANFTITASPATPNLTIGGTIGGGTITVQ